MCLSCPQLLVGHQSDWVQVPPAYLPLWRQLGFSPPGGPKTLTYLVLAPSECAAVTAAYMKVSGCRRGGRGEVQLCVCVCVCCAHVLHVYLVCDSSVHEGGQGGGRVGWERYADLWGRGLGNGGQAPIWSQTHDCYGRTCPL
jgi:hypothetical protein